MGQKLRKCHLSSRFSFGLLETLKVSSLFNLKSYFVRILSQILIIRGLKI